MPELLAKAKANPGKLNWASPAPARLYLAGELLQLRTGTKVVHIPFAGAGPATQAAVAGQVDMYTANIGSLMGLIDGGKLRPIAVTSKQRWPTFPMFHRLTSSGSRTPNPIPSRASTHRREHRQPSSTGWRRTAILARPDVREKFVKAGLPVVAEDLRCSARASRARSRCTRRSSTRRD